MHKLSLLMLIALACASPKPLHNLPLDLPQQDLKPKDTGKLSDMRRDAAVLELEEELGADVPMDVEEQHETTNSWPVRKCGVTLRFKAPDDTVKVTIPGEWNKWDKTADEMEKTGDGEFVKTFSDNTEVTPGEWGYKFLVNGKDWVKDPQNPLSKWVNGFENSKLVMPDCAAPQLVIDEVKTDNAHMKITIDFSVFHGINNDGTIRVSVTEHEKPVKFTVDSGKGKVVFVAAHKGKFLFNITVTEGGLRASEFIPVWLQDRPFTWKDAVIYFPMTDRFANGDKANDAPADCLPTGNKANWLGGDFAGLKQKIDEGYFDKLGINTIWLGPVWDNPDGCYPGALDRSYTAYHGYFPLNYKDIENHYGDMRLLKSLIDDAHNHGIRVIADLPANHVFQDSRIFADHKDWFHYGETDQTPLICSDDDNWNKHPIDCWFQPYLPDFDYTNNDAVDFVTDAAVNFVKTTGIDGFRVDAVKHMVPNFIKTLRWKIAHEILLSDQGFYMVGETFVGEWGKGSGSAETLIKRYVSRDQLDGQFDFPLYWAVLKAFARDEMGLDALGEQLVQEQGYYGKDAIMSTFIGNHDVPRFISHANGDIKDQWGNGAKQQGWDSPPVQPTDSGPYDRQRCAIAFLMCTPGIPMLYYGDEIGLPGAGDPDNRRPMEFSDLSLAQKDLKGYVEKETAFRHDHPATRLGTPKVLLSSKDSLAIGIQHGEDKVVCVFNRKQAQLHIPVSSMGFQVSELKDRLSGKKMQINQGLISVSAGPDSCFMLEVTR